MEEFLYTENIKQFLSPNKKAFFPMEANYVSIFGFVIYFWKNMVITITRNFLFQSVSRYISRLIKSS